MKVKLRGKSDDTGASSSSQPDYVFGSVSSSLFPKKSPSSGLLSSLFQSAPVVNSTQLYVEAPKLVPKTKQEVKEESDIETTVTPPVKSSIKHPVKHPNTQEKKKQKKTLPVGVQQVEDREQSLQNADEDDEKQSKVPKKKRRAADLEEEELERKSKKRKLTHAEQAEERVKLKRTVFVGNLPATATKKTLRLLFRDKGAIESMRFRSVVRETPGMSLKVAAIQRKVHSKKPSINAYVVFKEEEGAVNALEKNGLELEKDYFIRVDRASKNSSHDHKRSIFIGNLAFDISELPVRQFFQQCGDVESVRLVRDKASGLGKGFGYVLFESADAVQLALKLEGSKLEGRSIRVKRSVPKDKADKMAAKQGPRGKNKMANKGSGGKEKMAANKKFGGKEDRGPNKGPWKGKEDRGPNKGPWKGKEGRENKGERGAIKEGFKGGRETKGAGQERGTNKGGFKGGFKGRAGAGSQSKMAGKQFGGKRNASNASYKGEMADPTRKLNKKGLKKKFKPRKRDLAVHI